MASSSATAKYWLQLVIFATALASCRAANQTPAETKTAAASQASARSTIQETAYDSDAVRLTTPSDGQTYSVGDSPLIIEATVNIPHDQVRAVNFLSNGEQVATQNTAPYRVTLPPARIGNGTILLRAVAATVGGQLVESDPVSIHIRSSSGDYDEVSAEQSAVNLIGKDNVAASIYRPTAGELFAAPADILVKAGVLSTAGDIANVLIVGDGKVLTTLTRGPYEYLWRGVPPGEHRIVVRVVTTTGREIESPETAVTVRR